MAKSNATRKKSAAPDRAPAAGNQTFPERLLTVTKFYASAPSEARYPWLQLRGLWLTKAGFPVGTKVRVRVMSNCLVLTKIELPLNAQEIEVETKKFKSALKERVKVAVMGLKTVQS